MNLIDTIVGWFNPVAQLKRIQARAAVGMAQRQYDAAAKGRRTEHVRAGSTSANTELAAQLTTLRNRSRDLVRNNDYAEAAVNELTINMVGTGIRPSFSGVRTPAQAKRLKQLFNDWADSIDCDFDNNTNFYGLQELAARCLVESGECIVVKRINPKPKPGRIALQLQLLEPDHLDTLKDGMPTQGGGIIRQGIEFDAQGRKIAYWLFQQHPGDYTLFRRPDSVRYEADAVLHIIRPKRIGQIRSAPFGTSAFNKLRDLEEYTDATRIAKKVAACFSVFVTDASEPVGGIKNDDGYELERIEPGMIEYLQPGQEVQFAAPPTSEGYNEYMTTNLQGVAAGYGVTYEALSKDYSRVNFSSGRMGHISFGLYIEILQKNCLVPKFCSSVMDWFLALAEIQGLFSGAPKVAWTLPGRPMISPDVETKANKDQVRMGVKAWQDAVRESGQDPDELIQKIQEDTKLFDKFGLVLDIDPRNTDGQGQTPTRLKPNNTKKSAA